MVIYAWLVESLAQLGVFLTFKAPLPTTVASSSAQGDGSNFLIPPKWTVKYGDFYGFLTMGDPQHHPNLHQFLSERPMDFGIFTILRNTQTLGMRSLSGSIGSLFLSHRSSQMEGWQVCQPGATWVIQCQCSCLSTPIRCMRWNIIILNIYIYI